MEFQESEVQRAEAHFSDDAQNAENLTKWARSLLELARCQGAKESRVLMNDAISKLEEALTIEPSMDDALWCLGNAFTSYGYLTPDVNEAKTYFDRAIDCYMKAVNVEPNNVLYRRSLEISAKTLEMYIEMHKNELGQKMMQQSQSSNSESSELNKSNDFVYDIFGWFILAVGIVAWIGRANPYSKPL